MKEEIWNELYLYLSRIEIGVLKNFKECARSPCNGNHFSSIVACSQTLLSRERSGKGRQRQTSQTLSSVKVGYGNETILHSGETQSALRKLNNKRGKC